MNIFNQKEAAEAYDSWYESDFGIKADKIEKQLIGSFLEKTPHTNMLELGCGTGHWTQFFIEKGFEVTATDISEQMLELAKKKNLNTTFMLTDAQSLPFQDEKFDVVATITMLEFVSDRNKVFNEIYRVLKPGGWLITGSLNKESAMGKNSSEDEIFRHAHFFTEDEIIKELEKFGKPEVNSGVFLTSDFELVDEPGNKDDAQPVFIAAAVQKTR